MDAIASLNDTATIRYTPCGDGQMVWRIWGEGPPVVLLHGGSGSWTHWIRNIDAIACGHRVLAPDLPGLGDSAMPPRPFYDADLAGSVEMLAEVVRQGLAAVLPPPVRYHLVGFSLGSIVGAHVAARAPTRLRSFGLIGTTAMGLPWQGLGGELRTMTPGMPREQQLEIQRYNLTLLMLGRVDPADELVARVQLDNILRARIRTHRLADSDVLLGALEALDTVRLYAVWGARDIYSLPDMAARERVLASYCPEVRVEMIADAGHWVMYEQAETFNAALLRLLRGQSN